jgi:hypothetical protein
MTPVDLDRYAVLRLDVDAGPAAIPTCPTSSALRRCSAMRCPPGAPEGPAPLRGSTRRACGPRRSYAEPLPDEEDVTETWFSLAASWTLTRPI